MMRHLIFTLSLMLVASTATMAAQDELEQTAAPVITYEGPSFPMYPDNLNTSCMVSVVNSDEDPDADIYVRYGNAEWFDEYGEWWTYYEPMWFVEPGGYRFEAYAQTPGKAPSEVVSIYFYVEEATSTIEYLYDFIVDGIYYMICGESEVYVTTEGFENNIYYPAPQPISHCYSGDVVIPENVEHNGKTYTVTGIYNEALMGCDLTSIELPSTMVEIMSLNFNAVDNLTTVVCKAITPPEVSIFGNDCNVSEITLFVPAESLEAYRAHEFWGGFNRIESLPGEESEKTATPHVGEETQFTLSLENDEADPDAKIFYAFNGGDVWQEYSGPIEFHDFGHCYFENLRFYAIADGKLPSDTVDYDFYVHRYCYDFIVDDIYYLKRGAQTVGVSMLYDYYYSEGHNTSPCYSGDVVIPEQVSYEGRDYTVTEIIPFAFYSCRYLTSVVIPNTVTTIGNYAFEMWFASDLTKVDIGSSVETIGLNAFYRCNNIQQVICRASVPPTLSQEQSNYGECFTCYNSATLFVPLESLESYQADADWGRFSRIVPFMGAGPGDVNGDGRLSISDVTGIIDQLLSSDELPAYCDVNGDGMVNITDVTALINLLLTAD